ncbi:MAG: flagellar hook-associated protein FlgK [Clostridiaceae bacterium]
MGVSFASYEIARSGLMVNERGLFVTGHNISNVNTTGYVRQQAMIKNGPVQTTYSKGGLIQLGLGADIQEIRQIRHTFLDNIYRQENTTLGYWESRQKTFQDVQAIMAEPMESGLQNVLNQFWDSWQELSKEPDSLTVRALVRQRSEALVQQINHMGTQLDRLQSDLNSEIAVRIDEVNEITRQIADLNVTILKSEVNGDTANDYRDQRNSLTDRLTKLVKAEVNEMQDGQLDITIGGYFVVQKGTSTDLYAAERNAGDNFYVAKLGGTNTEVNLKSGIIKGLMESRGEVSGAVGSYENGTPNTKTDVAFVVDISDASGFTAAQFTDIKSKISDYANQLDQMGLDYNLRLVTTHGNNVINNSVYSKSQLSNFNTAVGSLGQIAATAQTNDFTAVFNALGTPPYRTDDNKYTVVFTNDNIVAGEAAGYNAILNTKGIQASVVTGTGTNWDSITGTAGGTVYTDLAAATDIGLDIDEDVSSRFSVVSDSTNIVSDMKNRLNSLVNVMLREINYIHKSGMNMKDPATSGEDFFVTINSGRPLEMGNIKLNPNLSDLTYIAASKTGADGDNSNALEIANLRNGSLIHDDTGYLSLDDYYQAIILNMGNNGSDSDRISESQGKLVQSADAYRTSITGVSMDEEMTNMMKYKFAYDAASRALNVIDSMMETIVNKLGLVGR